jgi:hypothetical protein
MGKKTPIKIPTATLNAKCLGSEFNENNLCMYSINFSLLLRFIMWVKVILGNLFIILP